MFAEKPLFSNSNSSNLHLPPINKSFRQRIRPPPPTPPFSSNAAKAAHVAENVSALKAKYMDYTTWLKTSTQQNREPLLTQELLKNSLCQMGIDTGKAEKLVSTCSWYVYQFQKDLKLDSELKNQIISIDNKKQKKFKNKLKQTKIIKENTENSTITSLDQGILNKNKKKEKKLIHCVFLFYFLYVDNSFPSYSRHNHLALPPIHVSNLSTSSRFRHVDFDNEQMKNPTPESSTSNKIGLKSLSTESSNILPIDLDLFSSQRSLRRQGLVAGHTRSILRKQNSPTSSNISTEIIDQNLHNQILTPPSKILDDIPLGTRSRRLFGGSECFAQIMNELEQQKKNI